MLSETQRFGLCAEDAVIRYLSTAFRVRVPLYRLSLGGDLFLNQSFPVYVKAARRRFAHNGRKELYSRFLFHFHNVFGLIGLVAVVCVTEANQMFLFLIPVDVAKRHNYLQICCHPEDYTGWACDYFIGVINE